MDSLTTTRLLMLGVAFHLFYSWSIFDIYFRSPIVHGMNPVLPPQPAPASRLVLFVADGLRADKLYENRMSRSPYLRKIVESEGTWGISHTRVPTESRPGHVAIIAGFYEDVSAVTRGWKTNPVNFDSLFNESTHTWSFGSPDILPMFAHGASDPHRVEMSMYSSEEEDFAKDGSVLDEWVFDKVEAMFNEASRNQTLAKQLRQNKIVFFFHLLGLDTNGHAFRPHSEEYTNNIRIVDTGVERIVGLISDFYKDDQTAFVVTADHGMSNIGNHGDGHPDNTRTPMIAWGAGLMKPRLTASTNSKGDHDAESEPWGLGDFERHDVNQADIAPLMSTLIGVPYPMNSVGVLPLQYVENTNEYKAIATLGNARQVLAQFLVKAAQKRSTEILFRPFSPLEAVGKDAEKVYEKIMKRVEMWIERGEFERAEGLSGELVRSCLDGLRYYQTYDWFFLRSIVSLGYVGWIVFSSIFIMKTYGNLFGGLQPSPETLKAFRRSDDSVNRVAIGLLLGLFAVLLYKRSPILYYVYATFPIVFWSESMKQRWFVVHALRRVMRSRGEAGARRATAAKWWKSDAFTGVISILLYIISLEILVYSYFVREILTPSVLLMGFAWPQLSMTASFRQRNWRLVNAWRVSCTILSIFTLLPVEKTEDIRLVAMGGVAIAVSAGVAMIQLPKLQMGDELPVQISANESTRTKPGYPTFLVVLSSLVVISTSYALEKKEGLPLLNSLMSWSILGITLAMPSIDSVRRGQHFLRRLVVIYLSFAPIFILLSISYEVLFYVAFSVTVLLWLLLERQLYSETAKQSLSQDYSDVVSGRSSSSDVSTSSGSSSSRRTASSVENSPSSPPTQSTAQRVLTLADLRLASFFLFFINVAFFGTGNIASISSFSIESVYRFTTVFNPFLMGVLLLLHKFVPFFLLSAAFGVLAVSLRLPPFSLFLLVVSTTDVMTLNFFFLVRDVGSWLEIGTTISHFVIASVFIVFQILLFSAGHILVGSVLVPEVGKRRKNT
ncbi:Phosphatidylinositolglycan class N-domain-containing protein [Cladochytrium replicatum]|nr:Phosphatidylinositolglycan class N-domain-containing protein [Cladochytrium replicatum]